MSGPVSPRLILSQAEKASPLWRRIEAHLKERLTQLRLHNDAPMPEMERCLHIGRIGEVKQLLSVAEETPASLLDVYPSRPGSPGTAQ